MIGAMAQSIHQTQRVAAYGLVQREPDRHILLVRLTDRTPSPGSWSLPGGGIDYGEHPNEAVIRELYEETGLRGQVAELLDVDSGTRETMIDQEVIERYQAVRILYRVRVTKDKPLLVIDVDGSSDSPTWFDVESLTELSLTPIAELARRHLH